MVNKCAVIATMLCAAALSSTPHLQAQQSAVKSVVLVHGAWGGRFGLEASTKDLTLVGRAAINFLVRCEEDVYGPRVDQEREAQKLIMPLQEICY